MKKAIEEKFNKVIHQIKKVGRKLQLTEQYLAKRKEEIKQTEELLLDIVNELYDIVLDLDNENKKLKK